MIRGREVYRRWEKRGQETGYPRGQESGEIGNEFCNIAQYFAIEKSTQRWEPLRKEVGTGSSRDGKQEIQTSLSPPPPPPPNQITNPQPSGRTCNAPTTYLHALKGCSALRK